MATQRGLSGAGEVKLVAGRSLGGGEARHGTYIFAAARGMDDKTRFGGRGEGAHGAHRWN